MTGGEGSEREGRWMARWSSLSLSKSLCAAVGISQAQQGGVPGETESGNYNVQQVEHLQQHGSVVFQTPGASSEHQPRE